MSGCYELFIVVTWVTYIVLVGSRNIVLILGKKLKDNA